MVSLSFGSIMLESDNEEMDLEGLAETIKSSIVNLCEDYNVIVDFEDDYEIQDSYCKQMNLY